MAAPAPARVPRETSMRIRQGLLALLLVVFAAPTMAMTADELIAKNIEAKGGIAKIKAIESATARGKMQFTGDFAVELELKQTVVRAGKIRQEASLQGMTSVQAYDGKEGWQIQPFGGRKDPEKLSADDVKGLADESDIDGPLVDHKSKGHAVEYLGTEDVDGTEAHKLKVTLKSGDVKYYYFDPDYFLEIRVTTQRKIRGVEQEFETDMGNYEQVAGVYMPFSLESGPKGGPKGQKITIEKVDINTEVDDSMFSFPATAAAPAK
jgi:outer membrane lipoprotein-sorting protein